MKQTYISVDIECTGPVPGIYSMVSLGAVQVDNLENSFYIEMRPMFNTLVDKEALVVTGFTEIQIKEFEYPSLVTEDFYHWLEHIETDRLTFVSDNAGFDWQFVNYYFHYFIGSNPFGYSPMSLTWFYKGLANDIKKSFKHLRTTKHTHNALDDAMGNAEALVKINEQFKLGLF